MIQGAAHAARYRARAGARPRWPQVLSCARGETTSGAVQRERPVQDVLWSGPPRGSRRFPRRRGRGTAASSFGDPVSADRRSSVRVGIRTREQAVLVLSPGFPSDPEMALAGCAKRRGARLEACSARSIAAGWQDARRGARSRPQDVATAGPPSLSEPVHEPAMAWPTAAPTVGTRSALRAALRPANSLPSRSPSIDRTSCAPRARCVSGSGPWRRSSASPTWASRATLRWSSQGARSAAVRARGCPAPSSLLVLQDARRGARPGPQDVTTAPPPRCLSPSTNLP